MRCGRKFGERIPKIWYPVSHLCFCRDRFGFYAPVLWDGASGMRKLLTPLRCIGTWANVFILWLLQPCLFSESQIVVHLTQPPSAKEEETFLTSRKTLIILMLVFSFGLWFLLLRKLPKEVPRGWVAGWFHATLMVFPLPAFTCDVNVHLWTLSYLGVFWPAH